MNILMIGHSQSGKTSYMAGLYSLYGNEKEGFGLWMSDSNKSAKLDKLSNNLSKGIYPKGTDISSEYEFWLKYDNSLLIPFNWYDYRGGALSESSKTSREAAELINKIDNADALIVFLDGKKIVDMDDDDLEDDYDILMWAIQKSISKKTKDGTYFPVSFVITKGDMYSSYEPLYNSPGVHFFMPLIKNIKNSDVAAGMLGICEVSKDGILNVFAPLIFSLYYGMHHYINERISSINYEVERYNNLYPGILDDVFTTLGNILFSRNNKTDREKAAEALRNIEKEKEQLKLLDSLGDIMGEILNMYVEKDFIIRF